MTRVVVVDDHELFRTGVIETLGGGGFAVVGEAANGGEALRVVRAQLPDIVLLDLELPDRHGLGVLDEIMTEGLRCKVVVLTVSEEDDGLFHALEAGAVAYIVKGIGRDELLQALRAVAQGERYVSPRLAADLISRMAPQHSPAVVLPSLTERERAVLEGITRGETNREIANALSLSEKTVKYYVTGVLAKLNVRNRVEAAIVARDALSHRDRAAEER